MCRLQWWASTYTKGIKREIAPTAGIDARRSASVSSQIILLQYSALNKVTPFVFCFLNFAFYFIEDSCWFYCRVEVAAWLPPAVFAWYNSLLFALLYFCSFLVLAFDHWIITRQGTKLITCLVWFSICHIICRFDWHQFTSLWLFWSLRSDEWLASD